MHKNLIPHNAPLLTLERKHVSLTKRYGIHLYANIGNTITIKTAAMTVAPSAERRPKKATSGGDPETEARGSEKGNTELSSKRFDGNEMGTRSRDLRRRRCTGDFAYLLLFPFFGAEEAMTESGIDKLSHSIDVKLIQMCVSIIEKSCGGKIGFSPVRASLIVSGEGVRSGLKERWIRLDAARNRRRRH